MSQMVKIIFHGVWDIFENICKSKCENQINFLNFLAGTYHRRIHPSKRLTLKILTGLIRLSGTDNYVSLICYIIPFKNHTAIYNTRSYLFYEI